jgi:hypothetical protein
VGKTEIKELLKSDAAANPGKSHISSEVHLNDPERRPEGISSITRRIKRLLDGLGRRGRRRPRVSMKLVAWVVVIFSAFIAGGGIYDLLDNPPTIISGSQGGWVAVHPYAGEQTLSESFVSMFLTLFIFAGMLVAYKSTQVAYDSRRANTMLVIGLALILLGMAGSHYLLILRRLVRG